MFASSGEGLALLLGCASVTTFSHGPTDRTYIRLPLESTQLALRRGVRFYHAGCIACQALARIPAKHREKRMAKAAYGAAHLACVWGRQRPATGYAIWDG